MIRVALDLTISLSIKECNSSVKEFQTYVL